jgi:hypothetical protein
VNDTASQLSKEKEKETEKEQAENTLEGTQAVEAEDDEIEKVSGLSYQDDLASLPDEFATTLDKEDRMSNIGGGMVMTWGTGF